MLVLFLTLGVNTNILNEKKTLCFWGDEQNGLRIKYRVKVYMIHRNMPIF